MQDTSMLYLLKYDIKTMYDIKRNEKWHVYIIYTRIMVTVIIVVLVPILSE